MLLDALGPAPPRLAGISCGEARIGCGPCPGVRLAEEYDDVEGKRRPCRSGGEGFTVESIPLEPNDDGRANVCMPLATFIPPIRLGTPFAMLIPTIPPPGVNADLPDRMLTCAAGDSSRSRMRHSSCESNPPFGSGSTSRSGEVEVFV